MNGRGARLAALGLLLLAFVAGALGGIAADRLLAREEAGAPAFRGRPGPGGPGRGGGGPGGPGGGAGAIFPRGLLIGRQLDLSAEQRARIEAILAEERQKADSVLRAVRPVLQARYDSATGAIREVLTVEQRARWDSLREERRGRFGRGPS